ncbi:unnamed protein product [Lampetra fluviatilis]
MRTADAKGKRIEEKGERLRGGGGGWDVGREWGCDDDAAAAAAATAADDDVGMSQPGCIGDKGLFAGRRGAAMSRDSRCLPGRRGNEGAVGFTRQTPAVVGAPRSERVCARVRFFVQGPPTNGVWKPPSMPRATCRSFWMGKQRDAGETSRGVRHREALDTRGVARCALTSVLSAATRSGGGGGCGGGGGGGGGCDGDGGGGGGGRSRYEEAPCLGPVSRCGSQPRRTARNPHEGAAAYRPPLPPPPAGRERAERERELQFANVGGPTRKGEMKEARDGVEEEEDDDDEEEDKVNEGGCSGQTG